MNLNEAKIEKGIPMPPQKRTSKWYTTTLSMEIGDSILFQSDKHAHGFRICANKHKIKLSGRKVEGGYRIWRVA